MADEKLVITTLWRPNLEEFLSAVGVKPGGFGSQILSDVFIALFVESIELKSEYKKYYSVEYGTFDEFMRYRFGQTLSDEQLEKERVYIIDHIPMVLDTGYDGNQLDSILERLTSLEAEIENQT